MEKKIFFLYLFFVLIFLLTINFAIAVTCTNVGERTTTQYCDVSGNYVNFKTAGALCLNSYECVKESCYEGKCQDKYVVRNTSLIREIWNWFSGKECVPGEDVCDGNFWRGICGTTGLLEEKNTYADGKCGYHEGEPHGNLINIIIDSPRNINYSSNQIPLEVYDTNQLAENWSYSLNSGAKISFTPNITISATNGRNSLVVYAKKSESSTEVTRAVSFGVYETSQSICGDGVCDANENASSCAEDCSPPGDVCGDGVCGLTESSNNCAEDCPPEKPKSWLWLFILLIIILISAIAFFLFLLFKKIKENKEEENKKEIIEKPKFPPQNPLIRQQFPVKPMFPTQSLLTKPIEKPIQPIRPIIINPVPIMKYINRTVIKEVPVEKPVIRFVEKPITRFFGRNVIIQEPPKKKLNIPKYDYVGSSETKTYHKHSCRLGKLIKRKYKLSNNSEDFFKKRGFKRCKACFGK